jgi:hypothetical protein
MLFKRWVALQCVDNSDIIFVGSESVNALSLSKVSIVALWGGPHRSGFSHMPVTFGAYSTVIPLVGAMEGTHVPCRFGGSPVGSVDDMVI